MKKIFLLLCLMSCTKFPDPTLEQLQFANYGTLPNGLSKAIIAKYLKKRGYFDPNSIEVEDCLVNSEKSWKRTREDYFKFNYGYWVSCDLNVKNRLGGYTGFSRADFLVNNDEILDHGKIDVFDSQNNTFSTKDDNFILWKN